MTPRGAFAHWAAAAGYLALEPAQPRVIGIHATAGRGPTGHPLPTPTPRILPLLAGDLPHAADLSRQLPEVLPRLAPVREPIGDELVPQQR